MLGAKENAGKDMIQVMARYVCYLCGTSRNDGYGIVCPSCLKEIGITNAYIPLINNNVDAVRNALGHMVSRAELAFFFPEYTATIDKAREIFAEYKGYRIKEDKVAKIKEARTKAFFQMRYTPITEAKANNELEALLFN